MDSICLTIDDVEVEARKGSTVLEAAQEAGIYIPSLCSHPDLPSSREVKPVEVIYRKDQAIQSTSTREHEGCQLCVVEIEGKSELLTACTTPVEEGMVVHTGTPAVKELRQRNLSRLLGDHPHTCLTCAQREGCAREPCSMKIDYNLRCCPLLGRCEFQKVVDHIGVGLETPRYNFADLPVVEDEPLFKRNYNLCIGCTRCVRVCQDVRGVSALGFVWHGDKAIVGTVAPTAKDSACHFCGACVEVCPTGALTDLETKWSGKNLVRCREVCPAGVDVPRYVRLINEEKFADALSVVREKVPFPAVLGHVCAHPCENECRRGKVNEPIAICNLKRFAAQQDGNWKVEVALPTNKKVAIVGSGPAGLTAAYYLAKLGHSVTIYESLSELGGMMRVGIPAYRVPREILKKEIEAIIKLGIDVKLNTRVGSDVTLDELRQNNDVVFLATGAHLTRPLNIEGIDHADVYQGVYLLHDTAMGKVPDNLFEGKRVVVIGGGNVAIDAARTALRLKAKEVQLNCLEGDDEMPAHSWEIQYAAEEGVILNCSWGPKKICTGDKSVTGVEFIACTSVFDAQGRFNPSYDENTSTSIDTDAVIVAIGQAFDISYLGENSQIELNRGGIKVDPATMETNVKGVYSGGDVATGPASVISAIGTGRKAAISIDQYLGGEGNIDETFTEFERPNPWLGREEGFGDKARVQMPCMAMEERIRGFVDIELGFDKDMAVREAKRCLQCDLRLEIHAPTLPPEKRALLEFSSENIGEVPESEGVVQLFDEDKKVLYIAGTMNMHEALEELLSGDEHDVSNVCYFEFEENDMYSKKESELMQLYMQEHGGLPELNDDLPF